MSVADNLGEFSKKGVTPWNKDRKIPSDVKAKMNISGLTGVNGKPPWNKGIHGYHTKKHGTSLPEEVKLKISRSLKGRPPWNKRDDPTSRTLNKRERERFRKEVQELVFIRDDYTCQICGKRGVDLQVDHIQSWADYIELRFDMKNCRTLCAKCHYKITFGKPMPDSISGWGHNLLKGVNFVS